MHSRRSLVEARDTEVIVQCNFYANNARLCAVIKGEYCIALVGPNQLGVLLPLKQVTLQQVGPWWEYWRGCYNSYLAGFAQE